MNWHHFDKYEFRYQLLFWFVIGLLQTFVGTVSVITDYQRLGLPMDWWKPMVWALSSQLTGIMLIFAIVWFDLKLKSNSVNLVKSVLAHAGFSLIYSFAHVVSMVLLRKLSYWLMGEHYDFGDWPQELVYEYTKDAYSYLWIIVIIYAYRFITARLRGEATVLTTGEDSPEPERPERLLVKKIGKEFMIKVEDIDWIEASGNYMNLHLQKRVYPLRETMANLERKLDSRRFVRIHRSTMVNLERIGEIKPLDSGDFDVTISGGIVLRLSRRYRDNIQQTKS